MMDVGQFEGRVTLHGLGFLQVKLTDSMRLHCWHPDLPRRHCWRYSQIHDHRFGFESTVLIGEMKNHVYMPDRPEEEDSFGPLVSYSHDGPRGPSGNRPWTPVRHEIWLRRIYIEYVDPGNHYHMMPYVLHRTEPLGDGRVVTLMHKTGVWSDGARSLCFEGIEPDAEFSRFQLSQDDLLDILKDALRGHQ